MKRIGHGVISGLIVLLLLVTGTYTPAQGSEYDEQILKLMEEIFTQIPLDITTIDARLQRIAVYNINTDERTISPSIRNHFESRLVEVLQEIDPPKVVALPEMNTLRISSSDSSFAIVNALPSPEELWRVGRNLRVDAFLEGDLVYVPEKALFLDLRLNRTGTNEVLWAKSYSAYAKSMNLGPSNPLMKSLNSGLEIFQTDVVSAPDSLVSPGFNNKLVYYTVYFGLLQYTAPASRRRYEFRLGLAFLSEGMNLYGTQFSDNSFYSLQNGTRAWRHPASYNFRGILHGALIPNRQRLQGDWLSVYFAVTRYFTVNSPDVTGFGTGLRSDINKYFSASAGFSFIVGPEFESLPAESTGETIRMKISGLQFEFLLLQLTF